MKGTAGPSVVSDLLENCYTQRDYDLIKRVAATSYTGKYFPHLSSITFNVNSTSCVAGIGPVRCIMFKLLLRLTVTFRPLLRSLRFSSQWPHIQMPRKKLKTKLIESLVQIDYPTTTTEHLYLMWKRSIGRS